MKANLTWNVSKNKFGEIVLLVTYGIDVLPKYIEYTYAVKVLLFLFKMQGKQDFMEYQFRYICDAIPYVECKDLFMLERQNIREKVLEILDL